VEPDHIARNIIKENIYLMFFAYDDSYNFYWVSPQNCRHSDNIRKNHQISWIIFDTHAPKWTGMAVYLEGSAAELTDPEDIALGLKLIWTRLEEPVPSVSDYLGNQPYRVYKAIVDHAWINLDKTENGKTIDARAEIKLA